ncbi:MAG: efflux RND transporter periplasmic adaptor subunit [Candidatus Gracilibacteria bacterium]|nr:efflux RND transporter periplasmic adaptor subunit [Candidatus Gracilibacteria bacterium]
MKIFKNKFFISFLVLLISTSGIYYFKFYKRDNLTTSVGNDVFYTVSTGSLVSSINVLGETNLLNEQKLKFNLNGTVRGVYVKEGDLVKTGDIIAELDKGELNNELKEAYLKLENSKLNLEKSLSKFNYEDKIRAEIEINNKNRKLDNSIHDFSIQDLNDLDRIKLLEENIKKSTLDLDKQKNELELEKTKYEKDFLLSKNDYEYKISNFENEKWKLEKAIIDEEKSLNDKITQYNRSLEDIKEKLYTNLNEYDSYLRNTNSILKIDKDYNYSGDINIYFSAKNSIYKNNAEISYWAVKGSKIDLEKAFNKTIDFKNINNLIYLLEQELKIFDSLYSLGDNISKGAANSIETLDFSQSEIDSINSFGTSIRSSVTSSKNNSLDNIDKLKNQDSIDILKQKSQIEITRLKNDLLNLKPNLEKAELDYKTQSLSLPYKINELEISYNTSKLNLEKQKRELSDELYKIENTKKDRENELKLSKLDYEISLKEYQKRYESNSLPEEIVLLQNDVKQAEINIDNVNKKIENYEIRAPFDGIIDNLNLKVGDNLNNNSTEEKYINLVNPNIIEVKIKLDQIDITKIKKGTVVNAIFDSYPDMTFTGAISFIDSKPTDDNGSKKYIVKFLLDKGDLNIYSGMFSNVEIALERIEDAVIVPSMSIELDNDSGQNFVTILVDGKKEKRFVELGITSNSMTQVISGLEVGVQVLEINFDANNFNVEDFKGGGYYGI